MGGCVLVFLLAVVLDLMFGDPVYPVHPVRLIGKAIAGIESLLWRIGLSGVGGGISLVVAVIIVSTGGYVGTRLALNLIHPMAATVLDVFIAYSCIAFQDLFTHAKKVANALEENDLANARKAVQMIIGRDAGQLDAPGVARAAVESVAESFVDGFLSPVFWFIAGMLGSLMTGLLPSVGAVVSMLTYRTINTMDSMVGYRSVRYLHFGRAAARLDDVANFVPARLSIPMIAIGAIISCNKYKNCIKIGLRDRLKHSSPNAGHAESCVAGALGIRLGGPSIYPSGLVEKPWLGEGENDADYQHVRQCCRLVLWSGLLTVTIFFLFVIVLSIPKHL